MVVRQSLNLFPGGAVLDTLSLWSDSLKSFQGQIGNYFACSEALLSSL